jgi:hypothetical protein
MAQDLTLRFRVTDEGTVLLDKISQKISGIDESAKKMSSSLSLIKLDSIINLAERAYRAGDKMYGLAKSMAEAGNEIQKNARVVGMSTEQYQQWMFAAKMSDVAAGDFSSALKLLSRNMSETAQGTGTAKEYFDAMEISVTDNTGRLKPLNDIMREIASKFATWENGPAKIAFSIALMGRSAEQIIPLFNQGAEGIDVYMKKASVLNDQMLETSSRMDETFKLWEESAKGWAFKTLTWIDTVIEGFKKYRTVVGDLEFSLTTGLRKRPAMPEYPQYESGPYHPATTVPPPTPNKEAADAFQKAMEKAAEAEMKMNEMFPSDAYNLRMMADEVQRIADAEGDVDKARKSIDRLKMLKIYYEEGNLSAIGYVRSLQETLDLQNKLTDKAYYEEKLSAEEEYQEKSRAINRDEEDWQKKQNALIDEYFKRIKGADKLKIPTHADVGPLEKEVREKAEELSRTVGIALKTTAESGAGTGSYMTTKTYNIIDYMKGNVSSTPGFIDTGGMGAAIDRISNQIRDAEAHGFTIPIYASGSTRKPVIEKINEIIEKFGGLEKAMSGMEAEINLAELTAEYGKLQRQLEKEQKFLTEISNLPSGTLNWNRTYEAIGPTYTTMFADLTEQMKILQMKMNYEAFKAYGGEAQTGIGYVPRTALYKLHEGERVVPKNVSSNLTINNYISGGESAREIAEKVTKAIKYNLHGELKAALK